MHSIILHGVVGLFTLGERDRLDGHEWTQPYPLLYWTGVRLAEVLHTSWSEQLCYQAFFSGPAFLAWQRMGNIQGWGGPLDDGWIRSQADLQKQIVARIREFGMINVLPGFAGHVPAALKDLYPNASFSRNSDWGHFNSTYSDDYLLQPNDTLFMQLGKIYYQMLMDEYGSDHVFNCDTYNEMDPDSTDLVYLADVNKAIYQTMDAVDKDAVFLMQGWLFHSGLFTLIDFMKCTMLCCCFLQISGQTSVLKLSCLVFLMTR